MNRRYMKKCIKKDIKREIKWAIEDGRKNQYEHYKKLLMNKFYIIEFNNIENIIGYKIFFQDIKTKKMVNWGISRCYFDGFKIK